MKQSGSVFVVVMDPPSSGDESKPWCPNLGSHMVFLDVASSGLKEQS